MEENASQYPDLFEGKVIGFGKSPIFVNHPEAIREIFTNDRGKLSAPGEFNAITKPLLGAHSLVTISGDRHKKRRKLVMPPFHGDRMVNYGELIIAATQEIIRNLPQHKIFSARQVMQEISLQIIIEVIFGARKGELYQNLNDLITRISESFENPLFAAELSLPFLQKDLGAWSNWGNFLRQREKIDEILYVEIDRCRRQNNTDRVDILSLLMSARDEDGNRMSDRELRDELVTLIFGGHETTATAMTWGLYWIHRLPDIKAKLLAELRGIGPAPNPMAIFRLPYLTAVCNETLRLYPPLLFTFPRLVKQPMTVLDYELQPDQLVVGCIYLLHHRADLYPDSKQFRPERFIERQFSPYELMPFGGGARRCIAEALAVFEIRLVLATVLANFELDLADTKPEKPARRVLSVGPGGGVKMKFG